VKNRNKLALLLITGLLICAPQLFAHHGNASFDTDKKLTMKATVTEWFWANPHCFLKFDVSDEKGNVIHWTAETSNPSDMSNLGWSKETFKPGDQVSVTLQPVKNGRPIGRVMEVVLPSGQTLGTRPAGLPAAPPDASKSPSSKY
jgi:hypothetical protein